MRERHLPQLLLLPSSFHYFAQGLAGPILRPALSGQDSGLAGALLPAHLWRAWMRICLCLPSTCPPGEEGEGLVSLRRRCLSSHPSPNPGQSLLSET